MLALALRTLFVYLILTLFLRISGKRQVGQMEVGDLVCALLLSELAALPLTDPDIPLLHLLIPVPLIILCEILSACLCALFPKFKRIVEGTPSILIDKGVLDEKQLVKARLSPDELLAQLRLKGVSDLSQVYCAVLEQNGQLSVIQKSSLQPVSPSALDVDVQEEGVGFPLIVNGCVNRSALDRLQLSERQLRQKIAPYRVRDLLLCTLSDGGTLCLIPRGKNARQTIIINK